MDRKQHLCPLCDGAEEVECTAMADMNEEHLQERARMNEVYEENIKAVRKNSALALIIVLMFSAAAVAVTALMYT